MKRFTFIFLLISFTLLQAKTFKGEVSSSGNVGCKTLTQKESAYVESICIDKVKVKYKLYSMMGEPVEIYAVYWELSPFINLRSGSVLASSLPSKVQEAYAKVSLHYKSKFVIDMYESNNYQASFRFSGGALKKSGRGYSFDTPGSPSWNKYMLKSSSGNTYYSKKEAIGIFKSTSVQAASFSFNKIENLGFSNLYTLNSSLKPKKEKKSKKKQQANSHSQQNVLASTTPSKSMHASPVSTQNNKQVQTPSPIASTPTSTYVQNVSNTNHSVTASLLLLIDVSGSMSGAKLKSAKQAALESIDTSLKKGVEISILAFSGNCSSPISKRINFTTDKQSLTQFVHTLSAGGGTPLGSALKIANNYLYQSKSSSSQTQMIILLADGDDNCGNISSVMASLRGQGIIFRHQTIGLEVNANSKAAKQLQSIASRSGGVYHHVKDHKQLSNIFKEALSTMEILDMLGTFGKTQPSTDTTTKNTSSSAQSILNGF